MRVSVVTPTYNRADTLPRAAESVFRQDYDDVEYIIVDDASEDRTDSIVEGFDFSPLKYESHDDNRGNASARNTALEVATGELILFLDSDDELVDGAISALVRGYERSEKHCGCVIGDYEINYKDGRVEEKVFKEHITYEDFLSGAFFQEFTGKLYPKDVFEEIGEFDEDLRAGVDTDYHIRLTKSGYHMESIGETVAIRHYSADNISTNFEPVSQSEQILQKKYGDDFPDSMRATRWARIGRRAAEMGEMAAARRYFRLAISFHPTHPLYHFYYTVSLIGPRGYTTGVRLKELATGAAR